MKCVAFVLFFFGSLVKGLIINVLVVVLLTCCCTSCFCFCYCCFLLLCCNKKACNCLLFASFGVVCPSFFSFQNSSDTPEGELMFREFSDLLVAVALYKVPPRPHQAVGLRGWEGKMAPFWPELV